MSALAMAPWMASAVGRSAQAPQSTSSPRGTAADHAVVTPVALAELPLQAVAGDGVVVDDQQRRALRSGPLHHSGLPRERSATHPPIAAVSSVTARCRGGVG